MKRHFLIILFVTISAIASAQTSEGSLFSGRTMKMSLKYWDTDTLALTDFFRRSDEWPKISDLEYGYESKDTTFRNGNTRFRARGTRTYMNPYGSWIHPDYANTYTLKYLQTAYDYAEVCRRRAETEASSGSNSLSNLLKFYISVSERFNVTLQEETQSGRDTSLINYYAKRVKFELDNTPNTINEDLIINPKGFGIGMHYGAGSELFMGPLAMYATPTAGIAFGFDFMINRFTIFWPLYLGFGGKYKKDIQLDGYKWNAGERMTGGNMELSLGYSAYDSQYWRIMPFAGIGVSFIDYPSNEIDPEKDHDEIKGFRIQAGVVADYKFFRLIENQSYMGTGLTEFALRTKLYVARSNFKYPCPAWSINLGVSVNMLAFLCM